MTEEAIRELAAIKRLLVLLIKSSGTKQTEIARALVVDESEVSRILSGKSRGKRK